MVNTARGSVIAPVIQLRTDDLLARQAQLLGEVNLGSYDEFRERARIGILSDREWRLRNELDSIAYLLGEDDLTD